jgi:hypothetical protein
MINFFVWLFVSGCAGIPKRLSQLEAEPKMLRCKSKQRFSFKFCFRSRPVTLRKAKKHPAAWQGVFIVVF